MMPSSLFSLWVYTLITRCTQTVGKMSFFLRSTLRTADKMTRPLGNTVRFSVFFWGYQNKIFQSVILSVSIFMMYMNTFWSSSKNPMLVFPFVWFGNFYSYVDTTITCFVKTFTSHGKLYPNLIYNSLLSCFDFIGHCFICTVWAARSVVIGIAVNAFFTDNRNIAKRTWFSKKSFHTHIVCQA